MELQLQFPPTPEGAPQHAEAAVETTRNAPLLNLDYSPESLSQIDQIIDAIRADGVGPLQVGESMYAFGCYVGEVFVRHNGAKWRLASETAMKDIAMFPIVLEVFPGKFCNPIGKVFKRLISPEVDDLTTFYQTFTTPEQPPQSAEAAGAVTPTDQKKGLWKRLFGG